MLTGENERGKEGVASERKKRTVSCSMRVKQKDQLQL